MGSKEKSNGDSKSEQERKKRLNTRLSTLVYFPEDVLPPDRLYKPSVQADGFDNKPPPSYVYIACLNYQNEVVTKRISGTSEPFPRLLLAACLNTAYKKEQIIVARDGPAGLLKLRFPSKEILIQTGVSKVVYFDANQKEKEIILGKPDEDAFQRLDLNNLTLSQSQEDPLITLHYNNGARLLFQKAPYPL